MRNKRPRNQRRHPHRTQYIICRKSGYGYLKKTVLVGTLCLFSYLILRACGRDKPEKIFMNTDFAKVGQPITLIRERIGRSEIKSCIWYVGDREVLRAERLISYIPREEDQENFIRVSVTLKDGSCYKDSLYFSVLPVLYVESGTRYDDVTKESYTEICMRLAAGDGYLPQEQYDGTAYIHLRGNSTATLLRNKLIYDFSSDIGADCKMNSENVSLIYNGEYEGVYQLCQQVRIEHNSVDVFNWEDLAKEAANEMTLDLLYQEKLNPEQREVVENLLEVDLTEDFSWMEDLFFQSPSLNILNENNGYDIPTTFDMREYIDLSELPDSTGGVLLEMDYFHNETADLKTNYALPFYYNKPQNGNTYQELDSYIKEYLQALEYAFHETDFTYHNASPHYKVIDEGWVDWQEIRRKDVVYEEFPFSAKQYEGCHYSDLIDFDSLLVNFLVCEVSMNWDSMKNSVYLYKDIEGPFYMGPAWDYDWAWGNGSCTIDTWAPESWQTTNEYFASEEYYQTVQWNRYLTRDPYFLVSVYEKYWEIRDSVIEEMVRDGGRIDEYEERYKKAADANDERWGGSMGNYEGQKFDDGMAMMKDFINQRIFWMDAQFSSPETLRKSLGYYVISEDITVDLQDAGMGGENVKIFATIRTPECSFVSFQVNGTHFYCAPVEDGIAEIEIPADVLSIGEKGGNKVQSFNTVQVRAMDEAGNYLINPNGTVEGEYQNAISNYLYLLL